MFKDSRDEEIKQLSTTKVALDPKEMLLDFNNPLLQMMSSSDSYLTPRSGINPIRKSRSNKISRKNPTESNSYTKATPNPKSEKKVKTKDYKTQKNKSKRMGSQSSAFSSEPASVASSTHEKLAKYDCMENCNIKSTLMCASRCLNQLYQVRELMVAIVAKESDLAKGTKASSKPEDVIALNKLSNLAMMVTNLSKEAFTPAHRLNATAIGLFDVEDYIRYPQNLESFDVSDEYIRIKVPEPEFNEITAKKLKDLVDHTKEAYQELVNRNDHESNLNEILYLFMKAIQNYHKTSIGAFKVFNEFLYITGSQKPYLEDYFLSITSIERSEVLMNIQELRRALDEIVIILEKLNWGSYVVSRLSRNKTLHKAPESSSSTLDTNVIQRDDFLSYLNMQLKKNSANPSLTKIRKIRSEDKISLRFDSHIRNLKTAGHKAKSHRDSSSLGRKKDVQISKPSTESIGSAKVKTIAKLSSIKQAKTK